MSCLILRFTAIANSAIVVFGVLRVKLRLLYFAIINDACNDICCHNWGFPFLNTVDSVKEFYG